MRHGNRINQLGRKSAHRKAMLANMASSLIKHKRISTTLAKARELRKYIEPLVTKSKNDTTHSRRVVFSYLQDKYAVTELFREVSQKVANRPGGYTRILKTGFRQGDNAEMCIIEFVDYNETYTVAADDKKKATKTRRGRKKADDTIPKITPKTAVQQSTEKTEEPKVTEEPEVVENVIAEEVPVAEAPEVAEEPAVQPEEETKKD